MIRLPNDEELQALRAFRKPGCVSIYIPFVAANAATSPMPIALKNALKEAATQLKAKGVPEKVIRRTLRPASQLVNNEASFWPHHNESLALFLHADFARLYRLPVDGVSQCVWVGRGFDVRGLSKVMRANQNFALLVLDHHATQLYVGDQFHLAPAPLKDFPADMEQTLNIDEFPSWRELHGIAPAYIGKGSEGYHSQYNVAEVNKQMLTEFFRLIDHRLHRYLTDRQLPLLIAGVGYLLPLYRTVNTYKNLVTGELRGSFKRMPLDALRERAWVQLRPVQA